MQKKRYTKRPILMSSEIETELFDISYEVCWFLFNLKLSDEHLKIPMFDENKHFVKGVSKLNA